MVAIASAQTLSDGNNGVGSIDALNNGFHLAFTAAAIVAGIPGTWHFVAIKKPSVSGGKEKEETVVPTTG